MSRTGTVAAVALVGAGAYLLLRQNGATIPEILGTQGGALWSSEDGGATNPSGLTLNIEAPQGFSGSSEPVSALATFADTPTKKSGGGSGSLTLRGVGTVTPVGTSSTGGTLLADARGNVIPATFNTSNLNTSTRGGAISSPAPSQDVASRSTPADILRSVRTKKEQRASGGVQ